MVAADILFHFATALQAFHRSTRCATEKIINAYKARHLRHQLKQKSQSLVAKRLETTWHNEQFKAERGIRFDSTNWYKLYVINPGKENDRDTMIQRYDDATSAGKQFRTRFRLPFLLYLDLLERVKAAEKDPESVLYRSSAGPKSNKMYPVELFLLGALRYMGRNATFDCLAENTTISESRHRNWTYCFVKWYTETQYPSKCRFPTTANEVADLMQQYDAVALPGIIGSMDGTVIPVFSQYAAKVSMTSFKQHCTVCNVQMIVSHARRILSVSDLFRGTATDSMMSDHDDAVDAIQTKELFTKFPVHFFSDTGNRYVEMMCKMACNILIFMYPFTNNINVKRCYHEIHVRVCILF